MNDKGDITYREWAPNAVQAHLIGDFSAFDVERYTTGKTLILSRQLGSYCYTDDEGRIWRLGGHAVWEGWYSSDPT